MRCLACGTEISEHVFPGASVRCAACGAHDVMAAPGHSTHPYREPAASPVPPRAPKSYGPRELRCPRCAYVLSDASASELGCGACQGVFVEHAELAVRIQAERPSPPPSVSVRHARSRPPEPTVRYGRCPKCSDVMTRVNFGARSGIVVDVCYVHGTWFDRGELQAALEFVREGGLEKGD
jgi:Zn-finger nucleic acid-binding protein